MVFRVAPDALIIALDSSGKVAFLEESSSSLFLFKTLGVAQVSKVLLLFFQALNLFDLLVGG